MFNLSLKTKQPFASEFLEAALKPGMEKLANSYLLTGSNNLDMYFLAMETARILNCPEKTENCICNNCSWIRQNRHPAVITVSPIDYIHPNKDGKPKTVITIDQARSLKEALNISSQYHRVVIFTDAREGKEYEAKAEQLWREYKEFISPPFLQNSDSLRENWIPQSLTYKTFHSEPANALLKIIEEPPSNITFFFLTKDKQDMLDTIVSRSQAVSLAYNPESSYEIDILEELFCSFPPNNRDNAIMCSEKFIETAKEKSMPLEEMLNILEKYMILQIRQNSDNNNFCINRINSLKKIQKAKTEIKNYVNPQAVMDSLLLGLLDSN